MAEDKALIENLYLTYLYEVPDLKDKKNDKRLSSGFFTLSMKELKIVPEINNKPAEDQLKIISFADITDVNRKIDLWRKAVAATTIIPIHHKKEDGTETVTLLSVSHDNAKKIKNYLSVLLTNKAEVDYVCPFSEGGKIFVDKKPITGQIFLKKSNIILTAEWLGKQQKETIDLSTVTDFEVERKDGNVPTSIKVTYQRDGVLISTLISSDSRTVSLVETYIKLITHVKESEEEMVELNEQQFMLLQMMYTSDINAETATEMLGVDVEELQNIVNDLVSKDILKITGEDEYELTEKGTKHIVDQMKKNLGG